MSKRLQHQFDRGDIVSLDMGSASAQAACKALVLSPAAYNVLGLALAVPITEHDSSRYAGFAVAILLPGRTPAKGAALVNLVRPVDLAARGAKLLGKAPQTTIDEALQRLQAVVGKD
ncbi:type II toxin-antitoxin system PemK/MazF family toxin [Pseudomonas aeruginosa]|uniref:type II toxin-antitoxin system PemK/MazF family toxin n=1 Tax=Pseudomonas aeruginosa TaxID=287 RepID=UPI000A3483B8|nr:type II toxin-antitoxin system PemK/MazF family toxin [Pseudomonas aeruginosa]OTH77766.1 toxin B [Pseudomonas aeruginosa]HBP0428858.1 toxin B [Pseudomonas aeruginosa]